MYLFAYNLQKTREKFSFMNNPMIKYSGGKIAPHSDLQVGELLLRIHELD